ncbi:MAG: CBS domain-containing protein [Candidatus Heimdallarchaeota archaeon]|nr:CBS domain-containing protein [Candidatus Heimdallarchaeota archaeon]
MPKEKEFLVRDLTIDDEYDTIPATASVQDAAKKMKENGIPDIVVLDEEKNYQGVIADFDIVTGLVAEGLSPSTSKVTEIMYTIEPVTKDTPVSTAFARMRDLDVSVVPVIENNEVVGVATITDCWGFLPEKYEDAKGLIPVSNPRLTNYSFTLLMTVLYLCFGIFAPLIGIVGYLKAPIAGSMVFSATYYLFEARGASFWLRYVDMHGQYELLWLGISIFGIIFISVGLFSAYAIFQWAYADYRIIKVNRNWQAIGVSLGIAILLVEWLLFVFFNFSGALRVSSSEIMFDFGGLILTGLAIICLLAAVSREFLFREVSSNQRED